MFRSFVASAFAIALGLASTAQAAPITFVATGNPDVVGFITFDDSLFDGTVKQQISNSTILALSLTVFGATFDLEMSRSPAMSRSSIRVALFPSSSTAAAVLH